MVKRRQSSVGMVTFKKTSRDFRPMLPAFMGGKSKRRQSEAVLPSAKNRSVSVVSFHSLSIVGHDKPDRYFEACANGEINVVEILLFQVPDTISKQDADGWYGLHHAALKAQHAIIQLLKSRGADVNCRDKDNNTPLHIAIMYGTVETVALLLSIGASGTVANINTIFPLMQAVISKRPDMVKALLSYPNVVDVNQIGRHQCTALHWAAKLDLPECATLLVKSNASLSIRCMLKYTPLHWAAKCAASGTLKAILQAVNAPKAACMEIPDRERNTTLHLAVDSGHMDSVVTCLEYGAKVDAVQDNKSTALHLACSQGYLPMVKVLYEAHVKASVRPKDILVQKDILGMTPLHRAAVFDHSAVVEYLLTQGKDGINRVDAENRTPLLAAAVRGVSNSFRILLQETADYACQDTKCRNVLHYLVIFGNGDEGTLVILKKICSTPEGLQLLNQKDSFGCTPLHLATKRGSTKLTEILVNLGAHLNLKNEDEQSPLHFAARSGRFKTVCRLLSMPCGPAMINETDKAGMTPLMVACEYGHAEVVKVLLQRGAMVHRDFFDRTVLHLAAKSGHVVTISELLTFHANLIDQQCSVGFTALHSAAASNQPQAVAYLMSAGAVYCTDNSGKTPLNAAVEEGALEAVLAMIKHERWNEVMSMPDAKGVPPLHVLIRFMPEAAKVVLDQSVTIANEHAYSSTYWQKFDFRYIHSYVKDKNDLPLLTLNTMVKYRRVDLLTHPITLNYLTLKWLSYGVWIFVLNILTYLFFAALFTNSILVWHMNMKNNNYSTPNTAENKHARAGVLLGIPCRITLSLLLAFSLINLGKEVVQIYCNGWSYFRDLVNYMEWCLYLCAVVFTMPLFSVDPVVQFNWPVGSLAIFMTWFNILFFLQRVEKVGIYIIMFRQILHTVIRVLLVFSVLFVAFGLAFHLLLWSKESKTFATPFTSMLQSVMFTMGEYEYSENFLQPNADGLILYPTFTFVFLVMFVIFSSLLLVNLLIGLSIGDIETIQRNATLKRLTMQVEYHTDVEKRLPKNYVNSMNETSKEVTVRPNTCVNNFTSTVHKLLGKKYVLMERSEDTADDSSTETRLEAKLNRIESKMNAIQNTLTFIGQKLDIVNEAYDDYDDDGSLPSLKYSWRNEDLVDRPASKNKKLDQYTKKKQSNAY